MTELITQEESKELQTTAERALTIAEGIKNIQVLDQNSMDIAGSMINEARELFKAVELKKKVRIQPTKDLIKWLEAGFNKPLDILDNSIKLGRNKVKEFMNKIEAEKAAKEAEIRVAHELAEKARKESLLKQAQEAMDKGAEDTAMNLMAHAETDIPAPKVFSEIAKPKNLGIRKSYGYEVTDKKKFIEACIKTDDWGLIQEVEVKLNSIARESQATAIIPGIRFFEK